MKQVRDLMNRKSDLQITPLIDIVFLLLVFFMVSSSLVKKEADLSFKLPLPTTEPVLPQYAVEVLIEVSEPGLISIEGAVFEDHAALIRQLSSIKASADASGSEMLVSILPHDKAVHGHVVPVMDACAAAQVENLSFNTAM